MKRLFTIGPVEMFARTLEVRSRQVPYFRCDEFSTVVHECGELLGGLLGADAGARTLLLTCSGTGAMEACVMNCLHPGERALVVDGGTFGRRFCELCRRHGVAFDVVRVPEGEALGAELLAPFAGAGHTALLVNLDETSTGQLYDLGLLSDFCGRNGLRLVVDAISAFLADPIDMAAASVDALIVSSQKALSLAPGLSCVTLSERMVDHVLSGPECPCLYFDFRELLANGERGQTPFTPAVGVVMELHDRLRALADAGGAAAEVARVRAIALDFRARLAGLPVRLPGYPLSNALTPVVLAGGRAREALARLEREHGFVLNPCGGAHAHDMVRVAHVGNHTLAENEELVAALAAVLG